MKLTVLHGSGLIGISYKLSRIRSKFDKIATFEVIGKEVTLEQLLLQLSSLQLFFDKKLVILKDMSENWDLLQFPKDPSLILILQFSKTLSKNSRLLAQAKILDAEIVQIEEKNETLIFPFLDKISEKKSSVLTELKDLVKEYGCQYILTMLIYMLRRLILPSKNLSLYSQKKVNQAKINFPLKNLKKSYKQILETDYKIKSGTLDEGVALNSLLTELVFS